MRVSSRFSIAVHILSLLAISPSAHCTSEWMASSVGTNPVVIRRISGQLKKAGLISVRAGSGGAYLAKGTEEINLLDVFRAVDVVEEKQLFHIHEEPNEECPVGANIRVVLETLLVRAQEAMEEVLKQVTLADLIAVLSKEMKANQK